MKTKKYAKLQNIDETVLESFIVLGHSKREAMCLYEYDECEVEILSVENNLYNIKLMNGLKFKGLSSYYLKGL